MLVLFENNKFTIEKIVKIMKVHKSTISNNLKKLVEQDIIEIEEISVKNYDSHYAKLVKVYFLSLEAKQILKTDFPLLFVSKLTKTAS